MREVVVVSSHSVFTVTLLQVELLVTRLSMLDSSSTNKLSRSDMMRSLPGAGPSQGGIRAERLANTGGDDHLLNTTVLLVAASTGYFAVQCWVLTSNKTLKCKMIMIGLSGFCSPTPRALSACMGTSFPPTQHNTREHLPLN